MSTRAYNTKLAMLGSPLEWWIVVKGCVNNCVGDQPVVKSDKEGRRAFWRNEHTHSLEGSQL